MIILSFGILRFYNTIHIWSIKISKYSAYIIIEAIIYKQVYHFKYTRLKYKRIL